MCTAYMSANYKIRPGSQRARMTRAIVGEREREKERETFIEAVCGLSSALLFPPAVNVTHGRRLQRREISHCSRALALDFLTAAELPGRANTANGIR